jgi:hypothetical protein
MHLISKYFELISEYNISSWILFFVLVTIIFISLSLSKRSIFSVFSELSEEKLNKIKYNVDEFKLVCKRHPFIALMILFLEHTFIFIKIMSYCTGIIFLYLLLFEQRTLYKYIQFIGFYDFRYIFIVSLIPAIIIAIKKYIDNSGYALDIDRKAYKHERLS